MVEPQKIHDNVCTQLIPFIASHPCVPLGSDSDTSMASIPITSQSTPQPATNSPAGDAFKTEYHPNSGRAPAIETFSTFGCSRPTPGPESIVDDKPWHPFTSRADFEFAELAHQAALNKDQTDRMLQLIWRIVEGNTKFTFKSHLEVSRAWAQAAHQMTPVSHL